MQAMFALRSQASKNELGLKADTIDWQITPCDETKMGGPRRFYLLLAPFSKMSVL